MLAMKKHHRYWLEGLIKMLMKWALMAPPKIKCSLNEWILGIRARGVIRIMPICLSQILMELDMNLPKENRRVNLKILNIDKDISFNNRNRWRNKVQWLVIKLMPNTVEQIVQQIQPKNNMVKVYKYLRDRPY